MDSIFSKQPNEIIGDDYFFHTWYEESFAKTADCGMGRSPEEYNEWEEKEIKRNFKVNWERRTLYDSFHASFFPWLEDVKFQETINKIAAEGKLFMDIASSDGMGLAAYVVKINPNMPCLVTDINKHTMKCLRSCVDEHLPEYNIRIASFDNNDMPVKDDSLDYITSIHGLTSSPERGKPNVYLFTVDREKAIAEVYRILKPGGYFVTVEQIIECDYDLQKLYNDYNEYGKLFGIYTYDEIQAVLELLIKESWSDRFTSAGFEVEVEHKYTRKYSIDEVKRFLYHFTYYNKIREWTDEEIALNYMSKDVIKHIQSTQTIEEMYRHEAFLKTFYSIGSLTKIENDRPKQFTKEEIWDILWNYIKSNEPNEYINEADDISIDIYHANNFYVLRKPD